MITLIISEKSKKGTSTFNQLKGKSRKVHRKSKEEKKKEEMCMSNWLPGESWRLLSALSASPSECGSRRRGTEQSK